MKFPSPLPTVVSDSLAHGAVAPANDLHDGTEYQGRTRGKKNKLLNYSRIITRIAVVVVAGLDLVMVGGSYYTSGSASPRT